MTLIERYLPASAASLFLALGDLVTNDNAATILKIGEALKKLIPGLEYGGMAGLLIIVLGAIFLCWIKQPSKRQDSYAVGMSVFTALLLISPYKAFKDDLNTAPEPTPSVHEKKAATPAYLPMEDFFLRQAYAQNDDAEKEVIYKFDPNKADGTIIRSKVGVSSCKPYHQGFLGLTSFINNTVGFCPEPYYLEYGTPVQILDCWDTGFRRYRYTKIGYQMNGTSKTGWVSNGQVPDVWRSIRPNGTNINNNCRVEDQKLPS